VPWLGTSARLCIFIMWCSIERMSPVFCMNMNVYMRVCSHFGTLIHMPVANSILRSLKDIPRMVGMWPLQFYTVIFAIYPHLRASF
jgi:uncharacterized membrane protein YjdF